MDQLDGGKKAGKGRGGACRLVCSCVALFGSFTGAPHSAGKGEKGIVFGSGSGSHGSYHTESGRHGDERGGWPGMGRWRYSGPAPASSTSPGLFSFCRSGAASHLGPSLAVAVAAEWNGGSVCAMILWDCRARWAETPGALWIYGRRWARWIAATWG